MDSPQVLGDTENLAEHMELDDTDARTEYDEYIIEYEDEREEMEAIDELDYIMELEERELERMAEEERLRQLIAEEEEEDVSEETPITPEEEIEAIERVSIESSIHPCLREIEISDSQLKLVNPYTVYPIPEDPGLLPAFWVLYERPPDYTAPDGVQAFRDAVKRWDLRSIGSFQEMLMTDEVNLRYYGIETQTIRAICEALMNNAFVQKLDLKDNKLDVDACKYLTDLLLTNKQIFSLSLSGCRIGAAGAEKLRDAISANMILTMLDLSKCDLGNEGFEHLVVALLDNQDIEILDLSHNQLDEVCCENLRLLLSTSSSLKHLNLSWNFLNSPKTCKTFITGLLENNVLLSLDLSWNSLGTGCLLPLCKLLSQSQSITKLNFSSNRFNEKDAVSLARSLRKNEILQEFYMGNNPIKEQGAWALVNAITPERSPNSVLEVLDLENVWANKDILPELEKLNIEKPWVTVKIGGILSNYQLVGPNVSRLLLNRANHETMMPKKKKLRRNFGHFVLSLQDKIISRERFVSLIKQNKLKLSKSLIEELIKNFKGVKEETVDQALLKSIYLKEYPETKLPPVKKLPKKKVKKAK